MGGSAFVRGYDDVRCGVPFDYDFVDRNPRRSHQYEIGRLFSVSTRMTRAVLYYRGAWTVFAVALFESHRVAGMFPSDAVLER